MLHSPLDVRCYVFSRTTCKYSDELKVSQNNFIYAQKLSIIDMIITRAYLRGGGLGGSNPPPEIFRIFFEK